MTGTTTKVKSVCLICLKRFERVTVPENGEVNGNKVIVPYRSRMLVPYTGLEQTYSHASSSGGDGSNNDDQQGDHCNEDLYYRFLQLTNRYLKVPVSETLLAFAKQHKNTTGENVQAFCDQCRILIGYVCDLYAELQAVKLHLLRKVEELETVTRQSVKCVSQKLSRGLFKTVSEQLNIKSVRQLELFRKSVIINCSRKRKGCSPQILVPRGLFPEQWKFTFAATKLTLMRLIVIFALVSLSPIKAEKKPPEGILKKKATLKRATDGKRKVEFEDIAHNFFEDRPKRKACANFQKDTGVKDNNENSYLGADDGDFPDTGVDDNDNDSDWSTGAASPSGSVDSAGSDLNLNSDANDYPISRKRRKLQKTRSQRLSSGIVKVICEEDGDEEDEDDAINDPDFNTSKQKSGRFKKRPPPINTKDATLPCKVCKKLFVDRRGLAKHLKGLHNTTIDYNCSICGLKCSTALEMTTHKRQVHGYSRDGTTFKNANLPCPKCKRKFVDARGLSRHMLGSHNSRLEYTCSMCGHKSKTAADHLAHRSKMHKRTGFRKPRGMGRSRRRGLETSCGLCNKQFTSRAEFARHDKEVHNNNHCRFECPVCMKQVVNEYRFKRHLIMHEQDSSVLRVFHCEVCGKSLSSENDLSEHFVSVHGGSYLCSMCDAKYPASSYLRSHLETHETDKKNYFCNFCFRGYTNEQYWQIHRKVAHVGKERMFCDQDRCAEEFSSVQELNEHLKKHIEELRTKDATEMTDHGNKKNEETINTTTEDKKTTTSDKESNQDNNQEESTKDTDKIFTCGKCGWGFLKQYSLTLHELVHIPYDKEIGGYCCSMENCGKIVRLKEQLISHYNNTHGGRYRPYECHECDHRFTNFISYKIHLRLHEERKSGRKFICDICNMECLDSIGLCAHKRTHDPNKKGNNASVSSEFRKRRRWTPMGEDEPPRRRGRPPVIPRTEEQIKKAQEEASKYASVPCEVCQTICESGSSLRKHLEKEHEQVPEEEKFIQCNFCYMKFVHKQTHDLHMISFHMQKYKFVCDAERCDEQFLNHVDLNNHLNKDHLITEEGVQEMKGEAPSNDKTQAMPLPIKVSSIVYCKTCNWGFVNPDFLELHELTHTPIVGREKYPCPACEVLYPSTVKLMTHYNTAHGKKLRPFKCLECPSKFFTKYGLRLHISRHDRRRNLKDDQKFVCIECGKGFMDLYLLNHHKKQHDPANHVMCPEGCGEKFVTKIKLNIHLKKVHGQGERFPCPVCGISFIYEYETKKHIEWTHGPPKYECEVCHKKYKRPNGLRRHKRVHNPDGYLPESYMCYECGSQYKSEEGLKYHVASKHTPQHLKKFACPHCPYKVHRRALFKMHLKVCLRNKGLTYDEEIWGKLPVVKQSTGPRRKPGRKTGWKKKPKDDDEDEMDEKSTTEDEEEEEDEEEKHDVTKQQSLNQQQQANATSSSTANVINAIIANLTGLPELGTFNEPNNDSIATRRGRRGNARLQNKEPAAAANTPSSSSFASTIDNSLFQSMSQQQLLPHQMPNHPQLFGNTNVPNYQNWLNTTSASAGLSTSTASSFPAFQQHEQLQQGSNEQKLNFNHTPPPTQHGLQHHQNVVYSPNHIYSPPLQDHPQKLHYGARK